MNKTNQNIFMNIRRFTTTIIKATEGFILTNASGDIDIKDRLFASELALGANDSEDNYIEMPIEKARSLMEAQEEALKNQRETV